MFANIRNKLCDFGVNPSRKYACEQLEQYSYQLRTAVLKCIIYENSNGCWHHWVYDEITTLLYDANDIHIKSRTHKLSKRDYRKHLFYTFGETERDAGQAIEQFADTIQKSKEYLPFDWSWGLVRAVTYAQRVIPDVFSYLFTRKNSINLTNSDIERIITEILTRAISCKH